jgi:hypothetical protein
VSERYVTDDEALGMKSAVTHITSPFRWTDDDISRLLATREAAVEHLRAVLEHVKRNADMEYESPTVRAARAFLASLAPTPTEEPLRTPANDEDAQAMTDEGFGDR